MVYDAPLVKKPFKQRLEIMKKVCEAQNSKHLVFHKQEVCKSKAHLDEMLDKVLEKKGEGMMIKDPKSSYE